MAVRRRRFSPPTVPRRGSRSGTVRQEIVEPIGGLNSFRPETALRLSETPFTENFVIRDRFIVPRSGQSQWGSTTTNDTPLLAAQAFRVDELEFLYTASEETVSFRTSGQDWADETVDSDHTISSGTDDFYDAVSIYNGPSDNNIVAFTNWINFPSRVDVGGTGTAVSNITDFNSHSSSARYVEAFDDRLIFFHLSDGTTTAFSNLKPNEVRWSVRGAPTDFTSIGAGVENLAEMKGPGTGMVSERDRLVLFSTKQVWGGRPRRDVFAFDFFPLDVEKGCPYPRTPQNTDAGTIWLGEGFQFYRLIGNEVRPIGDEVRDFLEQKVRETDLLYSAYNPDESVYALYYSDTTGEYPSRALFLRTDKITRSRENPNRDRGPWMDQDFGTEIPAGGVFGSNLVQLTSDFTAYRLRSDQTNDDGSTFNAKWRSRPIEGSRDPGRYEALTEAWLEVDQSSSTATTELHVSEDRGGSFRDVGDFSTSSTSETAFLPIEPVAARHPQFELRVTDGSQPRIGRIRLTLRSYTGRFSG